MSKRPLSASEEIKALHEHDAEMRSQLSQARERLPDQLTVLILRIQETPDLEALQQALEESLESVNTILRLQGSPFWD
jgi:hypothetical protein